MQLSELFDLFRLIDHCRRPKKLVFGCLKLIIGERLGVEKVLEVLQGASGVWV